MIFEWRKGCAMAVTNTVYMANREGGSHCHVGDLVRIFACPADSLLCRRLEDKLEGVLSFCQLPSHIQPVLPVPKKAIGTGRSSTSNALSVTK